MSNIHDIFKDECVSGQIIGSITHAGAIYYDGRKQCQTQYSETLDGLQNLLDAEFARIKAECRTVFDTIYPLNKWEGRIYE
jgi:hypothetical protein